MNRKRVDLPSGAELTASCIAPPVSPGLARQAVRLVTSVLSEPYLSDILRGGWSEHADFRVGLGMLGGELAGAAWVGWGRNLPDIGVMGGVATSPRFRRQGIAGALVGTVCDAFAETGGRFLFLATTNPDARRIYERLGFTVAAGNLLCRAAKGARVGEGFAPGRAVVARSANLGDLGAILPLYSMRHPCVFVDAHAQLPSARIEGLSRCVGLFWRTYQATIAAGGRWRVLENDRKWLVASAIARRRQDRGFTIDFIWHPACMEEGRAFVSDSVRDLECAAPEPCEMVVCEQDDWKLREARLLGFGERIGAEEEVVLGARRLRLVRLRRRR